MPKLRFALLFALTGALLAQAPDKGDKTDKTDKVDTAKEVSEAMAGWSKMSGVEKVAALNKVAGLGGPAAVHALTGKLHEKDGALRKEAAAALGKMKDDHAVPALINALDAEGDEKAGDVDAFVAVCHALGDIGDARAIQPLVHGVLSGNRREANWQKRGNARIEALGGIRSKDAIDELLDLWVRGTSSSRATGSMRGGGNANNPFSGAIVASLNKLTGQTLNDQKAYHDWWKDNRAHFKFKA